MTYSAKLEGQHDSTLQDFPTRRSIISELNSLVRSFDINEGDSGVITDDSSGAAESFCIEDEKVRVGS